MVTLTEENWLRVTAEVNTFLENIAAIDYGTSVQLRNAIVDELKRQILLNELLLQAESEEE